MNSAGNSQQRSDTDVFEALRKGQALAGVAAALLTGIATLHLPTISSGFHVWWAHLRLPGTAASHRDLGCSSLTILIQEEPVCVKRGLNLTPQYFCFP